MAQSHPLRAAVEARDHAAMVELLAPEIVFHTPVRHTAVEGREAVSAILAAVLHVFEDFEYTDELESGDGAHALVFRATVETPEGDRRLDVEGLDLLRMNADGLIASFTVMVRPLRAAQALAQAMGKRLGMLPR